MMVNDVCLLKDEDAFRSEWKLARVVEVYPDRFGNVRNVEVLVKPAQDGSSIYKPSGGQLLRRHVNNLLLLVPVEEQDASQTKTSVERAEDKSKAVAVEARWMLSCSGMLAGIMRRTTGVKVPM